MEKIWNLFITELEDTIEKLGIAGSISYIGAVIIFTVLFLVDFSENLIKALILLTSGIGLLIYSGFLYRQEVIQESLKIKEALGVLREVYNRLAEQVSVADKEKTVSITMTINNLPDKIADVIKKSTKT